MDTTDALAVVAIVVASIAFFVTVSQVLQQYFATAEGYRRCQYSVMGQWSGFTYRRFRWSELRFETRFITPHIRLGAKLGDKLGIEQGHIPLLQSTVKIDEKRKTDLEAASADTADWVCWVSFIEHIEILQTNLLEACPRHKPTPNQRSNSLNSGNTVKWPTLSFGRDQEHLTGGPTGPRSRQKLGTSMVAVHAADVSLPPEQQHYSSASVHPLHLATCALRNQSWDFMPPEVVKPLAMIWVGDLAILAARLGMKWLEFRPTEYLLRAEGNGFVLSSTLLRSIGCVVNVQTYATPRFDLTSMTISTEAANRLMFGYIPHASLKYPVPRRQTRIDTTDHVIQWMNESGLPSECFTRVRELDRAGSPIYGFVDLIPLTAAFLRQRGSRVRRVAAPMNKPYGILSSTTCWDVFRAELISLRENLDRQANDELSASLDDISDRYRNTKLGSERWWRYEDESDERHLRSLEYLEDAHDTWDWTTTKLAVLCFDEGYQSVVRTHVWHSILAHVEAESNLVKQTHYHYDDDLMGFVEPDWKPEFAETVHLWFLQLPAMYANAKERPAHRMSSYENFVAIWAFAVFRGMCWAKGHEMVEGIRVGSEHSGSRMPIYIG